MLEINNIYNCDCIVGMSEIPDESIDMVLCDLPYNTIAAKWDKLIPSDKLWEHYRRITKKNAAIVLFGSEPFATNVRNCAMDLYKYDWIWVKNSAACFVHAKNMPLKNFEVIMVFSKGGMGHQSLLGENRMNYFPQGLVANHQISKRNKGSFGNVMGKRPSHKDVVEREFENYPKSVLYFDKDPDSFHPTQKPVSLLEYLIRTYTNEGDLVLDNCMGSGATAIAAVRSKRNYLGFETDNNYYVKSLKRIEAEKSQLTLF